MNYETLQKLINENKSTYQMAKELGKSQTSIRHWLKKYGLSTKFKNFRDVKSSGENYLDHRNFSVETINKIKDESHLYYFNWNEEQKQAFSYILGFYLGDGCVFQNNNIGNSYTLVLASNEEHININIGIIEALNLIFPTKKVHIYDIPTSKGYEIKIYGIRLDLLFDSGKGKKHNRKIELKDWQLEITKEYPKDFIKGLIQSDGCRYVPRLKECPTYIVYTFTNCSSDIHKILHRTLDLLNIQYTHGTRKGKYFEGETISTSYYTNINHKKDVILLDSFIGTKS